MQQSLENAKVTVKLTATAVMASNALFERGTNLSQVALGELSPRLDIVSRPWRENQWYSTNGVLVLTNITLVFAKAAVGQIQIANTDW